MQAMNGRAVTNLHARRSQPVGAQRGGRYPTATGIKPGRAPGRARVRSAGRQRVGPQGVRQPSAVQQCPVRPPAIQRCAWRQRISAHRHIRRRQGQPLDQGGHRGGIQRLLAAQQAVEGAGHRAGFDQRPQHPLGVQRGGAQPAGVGPVLPVHDAVEQPGRVARRLGRSLALSVKHLHGHALRSQRAGHGGASQPGADDGHAQAAAGCRQGLAPRRQVGQMAGCKTGHRHLALGCQARGFVHLKTRRLQPLAHLAGHAPGGQRGTRCGQPGQAAQAVPIPHLRVARRRKPVEVDGIGLGHQVGQHPCHIAQRQQQAHAAGVEVDHMQIGRERWPVGDQLPRQRRQGRCGMGAGQVGGQRRVLVDGQIPKPVTALCIVLPGGPGGQKVVAQAKPGLQHHKPRPAGPPRRQAVAAQKHMAGLRQGAGAGVVDIAKLGCSRGCGV